MDASNTNTIDASNTNTIDIIYIIVSSEFEKDRLNYLTNYFNANKTTIPIKFYEPYYKNRDESKIDFSHYENMSIPEIMLSQTYEKIFEEIIKNNYKYVITLESDVLFCENFFEKLNGIFNEWITQAQHPSVVFFGNGSRVAKLIPEAHISENLYEMNISRCTDSMLFDRDAVVYLYDKIKHNKNYRAIDSFLETFIGLEIYGYWLSNPITIQGSQNGTYESTIQLIRRRRGNRRRK
jgi:GR25 family glycosyltransferase involved in LPS biosynthesis